MTTPTYPGVYVVEELSTVHTIMGVPTSVAAFAGAAARGPANTPVRVNNWAEYERTFGALDPDVPMSYSVFLFFVNGGAAAHVVRLDGPDGKGAVPSTIKLNDKVSLVAKSPGTWGNSLQATIDTTNVTGDSFNLTVTDTSTDKKEQYSAVSVGGPNSLAAALRRSNLVNLAPVETPVAGAPPVPVSPDGKADHGADATGKLDVAAGWRSLARVDIFNMLCLPTDPAKTYDKATLDQAAGFCRNRRAVLIVDPPPAWGPDGDAFDQVTTSAVAIDADDCAAVYYPNVLVTDRLTGVQRSYGPSGAVAGVWARTDAARGVWKAPAGMAAGIAGIDDLEHRLSDDDIGVYNPLAVNALKVVPFSGPVVWGARTAAGVDSLGSQWKYLPVRRLALFLEESLRRGTEWAVFEPNDEPLWSSLRLNIGAFMNSLFRRGAFQGSTPSDAYFVKCDAENNPQNDIDRGIVNVVVGFAPLKPAEFVVIHIEQLAGQLQT